MESLQHNMTRLHLARMFTVTDMSDSQLSTWLHKQLPGHNLWTISPDEHSPRQDEHLYARGDEQYLGYSGEGSGDHETVRAVDHTFDMDYPQDSPYMDSPDSPQVDSHETSHKEEEMPSGNELLEAAKHHFFTSSTNEQLICKVPRPVVHRVVDYEHPLQFLPSCIVLHRCTNFTGCCAGAPLYECGPIHTEVVKLPFLVFDSRKHLGKIAIDLKDLDVQWRTFVNHTQCGCTEKKKICTKPCPSPFYQTKVGDTCLCDCVRSNDRIFRQCLKIKIGDNQLDQKGVECVKAGHCYSPECFGGAFSVENERCPMLEIDAVHFRSNSSSGTIYMPDRPKIAVNKQPKTKVIPDRPKIAVDKPKTSVKPPPPKPSRTTPAVINEPVTLDVEEQTQDLGTIPSTTPVVKPEVDKPKKKYDHLSSSRHHENPMFRPLRKTEVKKQPYKPLPSPTTDGTPPTTETTTSFYENTAPIVNEDGTESSTIPLTDDTTVVVESTGHPTTTKKAGMRRWFSPRSSSQHHENYRRRTQPVVTTPAMEVQFSDPSASVQETTTFSPVFSALLEVINDKRDSQAGESSPHMDSNSVPSEDEPCFGNSCNVQEQTTLAMKANKESGLVDQSNDDEDWGDENSGDDSY
ncbi:uncharacterized protein LOC131936553 [Physella acuta]|uniref:uncharacterized protein LOC131936553 n=1 Tax=Physella acuta TaxID=109671 RepID=UPI0027DDFE71|nr:uncharacterized protein LOC131936553 [Physella acuta]